MYVSHVVEAAPINFKYFNYITFLFKTLMSVIVLFKCYVGPTTYTIYGHAIFKTSTNLSFVIIIKTLELGSTINQLFIRMSERFPLSKWDVFLHGLWIKGHDVNSDEPVCVIYLLKFYWPRSNFYIQSL
jgi:hypothetical protein